MHPNIFTDACRYSRDRSWRGKLRWRRRHDREHAIGPATCASETARLFSVPWGGGEFHLNDQFQTGDGKYVHELFQQLFRRCEFLRLWRPRSLSETSAWRTESTDAVSDTGRSPRRRHPGPTPRPQRIGVQREPSASQSLRCQAIREEVYLNAGKSSACVLELTFPV